MLIDVARADDIARLGRQQSSAGVTDMASFGFVTNNASLAASSSITLAVGASAAPETAFGAEIAGRAAFAHAIDAPALPFIPTETIVSSSIGASFGSAPISAIERPAAPTPPTPGSSEVAPAVHADEALPVSVASGSGTSPEILQPPAVASAPTAAPAIVPGEPFDTAARGGTGEVKIVSDLAARALEAATDNAETVFGGVSNLVIAPVIETVTDTAGSTVSAAIDTLGRVVGEIPTLATATVNTVDTGLSTVADTAGAVVVAVPALADVVAEAATSTFASVPGAVGSATDLVTGTTSTVTDVADVVLKGADPDGGLSTLGELLDGESAFEITNPADGAVVFSSVTAPVVDALEPVTHLAEPLDDTVSGLVDASLPLSGDDHDDHGLGHALGGLFDHG